MMTIQVGLGSALASLALMALTWQGAAAPLKLTGAHTASAEFVMAASQETSTRPGTMLELRLTITEAGGTLKGFLDAQVEHSVLRFAFAVNGTQRQGRVDLAVQVNLCVERPSVHITGTATDNGAITFAATAQTITCNFARVYLQLPRAVHLNLQIAPK
jgi:hypothetical protein